MLRGVVGMADKNSMPPPAMEDVDDLGSDGANQEKFGTLDDKRDMRRMGKKQELRRAFKIIPIFGLAMTLMSTWEGVMSSSSYVLPNGGRPGIIWTFFIGLFGMGAAILSMAEMASMAPTSGGQYHWASEFAPPESQKVLSYVVGWLSVLGWQAGIAGQCFSVGSQIQGLIVLNDSSYRPEHWHATLLTIGATLVCVFINTVLVRRLPLIETMFLVLHVVGFFAIMITLWVLAPKAPSSEVWTGLQNNAGWPTSGLSFLVGLTSSTNALLGPDASVHLSEEVQNASRTIPIAMSWTLIVNGVAGFVMAVTFAYCLGPLQEAIEPPYFWAFIGTFYNATRSHAGATVMSCVIIALTLCSATSNLATGSRQMFAFARDNGLPFSRFLSSVYYDIPLPAILVSFTIAALLSLINLGSDVAFNAILSIGIVSLLSSYLVTISCILLKRIRGERLLERRWSLGVFGGPLNACAIAYLVVAYVFAFFPIAIPVTLESMNWASAVYGGVAVIATAYFFVRARKTYIAPVSKTVKDF